MSDEPASQAGKGARLRALHVRERLFVIPNPWDAGSARLLAGLGFEALATTSAGHAFALGRPDAEGQVSRDETLANARSIVEATPLPVSADLEGGFGAAPEACAETVRLAADAGLVGGSIEDATGDPVDPIHPLELAVERVAAAVRSARALPFDFTLTARAENLLYGRHDLADTIRRLQAYAEAGADVLYAPGLRTAEDIGAVVRALAPKPVNVVMGLAGAALSLAELEALGVRRVSLGSSLARAAYGELLRAAREVRDEGRFGYAQRAVPFADLNAAFRKPTRP